MKTSSALSKTRTFTDLMIIARHFAECFPAYLSLDDEGQADIRVLIESLNDSSLEEHERESIYATLAQSLIPEALSSEAMSSWDQSSPEDAAASQELDEEEQIFVGMVTDLMKEKKITQTVLGEAIGIGQPAVSLLLSRKCRPQRRTVEKIARALGVEVCKLWPSYYDEKNLATEGEKRNDARLIESCSNWQFYDSVPREFQSGSGVQEFHFGSTISRWTAKSVTEWEAPESKLLASDLAAERTPSLAEAA